jgi:hypothetical protein
MARSETRNQRNCSFLRPPKPALHTPVVTRPLSTRRAKGLVLTPYSKVMHLSLNGELTRPTEQNATFGVIRVRFARET